MLWTELTANRVELAVLCLMCPAMLLVLAIALAARIVGAMVRS